MSSVGAIQNNTQRVTISSTGSATADGWSTFAQFDNARLPESLPRDMVFIVAGKIGSVIAGSGIVNAQIEVGLRLVGQPSSDSTWTTRFYAADGNLQQAAVDRRAVPFFMIVPFRTGIEGQFNGTLELIARTKLNGDPAGSACSFAISDVVWLAFDLANLGSSNYFLERYDSGPVQPSDPGRWSYSDIHTGSALPWNGGPEYWLCFGSAHYEPQSFASAPAFAFSFLQGQGPTVNINWLGAVNTPLGMLPRGVPNIGSRAVYYQHGGMGMIQHLGRPGGLGALPKFRAVGTTPAVNVWYGYQFGIRWAAFAKRSAALDFASEFYQDSNPPPGSFPNFVPFEPFAGEAIPIEAVVLSCSQKRASNSHGRRSYGTTLLTNQRTLLGVEQFAWTNDLSIREGVHDFVGISLQGLGQNEPQIQVLGFVNAFEPSLQLAYFGDDQAVVAFSFETDPDAFDPDPPDPPPPTVVIVPAREAADLSSLTALPYEPEMVRTYELDEGQRHELFPEIRRYRITWPKFAHARQVIRFEWVLQEDDRDTLVQFFEDQSSRAFKWTPPQTGASTMALQMIRGPEATDLGNGWYLIRAAVLELVFVGS